MLRCKIRMMRTGPPKTRDRWSFWKKNHCPSERWPWRWWWTRRLTSRGTRSWLSSLDIKDDEYWLDHPDQRTVGHSEKKQLSVRANVASKLWRMAGKIKTIATLMMNHFQNHMQVEKTVTYVWSRVCDFKRGRNVTNHQSPVIGWQ